MPARLHKLLKGLLALLKICTTAVLAFILGGWLISFGDQQSIVAGCGAILVGSIIVAFVVYSLFFLKDNIGRELSYDRSAHTKIWKVVWIGVFFVLAPGFLYLYFCATMDHVHPIAIMILGVPVEIAGLGMVMFGLLQIVRKMNIEKDADASEHHV
jgi:hypothetical protein